MTGRNYRDIQEGIRIYANRRNGWGERFSAILSGVDDQFDLGRRLQSAKGILYNPDGTLWQPQSPDGSLPQLKGYDFPADITD